MIQRRGAVEAAKQLLKSGDIQSGFEFLMSQNRPDLTVEHAVLDDAWRPLFSESVRDAARWRIDR